MTDAQSRTIDSLTKFHAGGRTGTVNVVMVPHGDSGAILATLSLSRESESDYAYVILAGGSYRRVSG